MFTSQQKFDTLPSRLDECPFQLPLLLCSDDDDFAVFRLGIGGCFVLAIDGRVSSF